MNNTLKVQKLIKKLERLAADLYETKDLAIHQKVSQFFHMEKAEELKTMLFQMQVLKREMDILNARLADRYMISYCQWKKDVRRLHRFINIVDH